MAMGRKTNILITFTIFFVLISALFISYKMYTQPDVSFYVLNQTIATI